MGIFSVFKDLGDFVTGGLYSKAIDTFTGENQNKSIRDTNQTNLQIARETNDANYKLWKEQTQYNDPTAQMERLKRAGLNPQLALGSLQNSASSPPTMQGATMQPEQGFKLNVFDILGLLMQGQQLKKATYEADITKYQKDIAETMAQEKDAIYWANTQNDSYFRNAKADSEAKELQNENIRLNQTNLIIQRNLTTQQLKNLQETYKNLQKSGKGLDYDNQIKQYKANLAKAGLNPESTGIDFVIDSFIKNPGAVIKMIRDAIFEDIPSNLMDLFNNSNKHNSKPYEK